MRPTRHAFLFLCASFTCLATACAFPSPEGEQTTAESLTVEQAEGPSAITRAVDAEYSRREVWQSIDELVYSKISDDTAPCATYLSFALERIGHIQFPKLFSATIRPKQFPVDPGTKPSKATVLHEMAPGPGREYSIRTNTTGLAAYLMEQQNFRIVWEPSDLEPGDIVFALPFKEARHPYHAFMFHAWHDKSAGWMLAIDNNSEDQCEKTEYFTNYCADKASYGCCESPGARTYRRSVTQDIVPPWDRRDVDTRMWFALRGPK